MSINNKNCRYTRTRRPARKKNRAGRTGYYKPEMCAEAADLVGKMGARMVDLADYFDVNVGTIEYWQRTKPEFARALKRGRVEKSLKLSQAMFHRAVGYSHQDTHIMANRVKVYDEEGRVIEEHTEPLLVPIVKHYPPDAQAAFKMLTILMREVWSESTSINHNHNIDGQLNINNIQELSMDDLTDEMKEMLFQLNLKQLSEPQSN